MVLELEGDIRVIGEGSDGAEEVRNILEMNPRVVVMDVAVWNVDGVGACRPIKVTRPQTGAVLFGVGTTRRMDALETRADDFLLKSYLLEDRLEAVRRLYRKKLADTASHSSEPVWRLVIRELLKLRKLAPELLLEALPAPVSCEPMSASPLKSGLITRDDLAAALGGALLIPQTHLTAYCVIEEPIGLLDKRPRPEQVIDPVEREAANLTTLEMVQRRNLILV